MNAISALKTEPSAVVDGRKIALVLQGGGALGSYQAGVYEGLAEAGIMADWIAGISIGSINAAIIAGNAPENRVANLRRFWEQISAPSSFWPTAEEIDTSDSLFLCVKPRRFSSVGMPPFLITPRVQAGLMNASSTCPALRL